MTFKKLMLLLVVVTPYHLPVLASNASASASASAMDIDRADERAADQKRQSCLDQERKKTKLRVKLLLAGIPQTLSTNQESVERQMNPTTAGSYTADESLVELLTQYNKDKVVIDCIRNREPQAGGDAPTGLEDRSVFFDDLPLIYRKTTTHSFRNALLKPGANPNEATEPRSGFLLKDTFLFAESPVLSVAATQGAYAIVQLLLKHKDIEVQSQTKRDLLDSCITNALVASSFKNPNEALKPISLLASYGAFQVGFQEHAARRLNLCYLGQDDRNSVLQKILDARNEGHNLYLKLIDIQNKVFTHLAHTTKKASLAKLKSYYSSSTGLILPFYLVLGHWFDICLQGYNVALGEDTSTLIAAYCAAPSIHPQCPHNDMDGTDGPQQFMNPLEWARVNSKATQELSDKMLDDQGWQKFFDGDSDSDDNSNAGNRGMKRKAPASNAQSSAASSSASTSAAAMDVDEGDIKSSASASASSASAASTTEADEDQPAAKKLRTD